MTDTLQKFMFDNATVRGELVELNDSWQDMLTHTNYPEPVRNLLGEMSSAAALLCANLKFDGTLIMQIHGDGAVKLLVVECNSDLTLRGMAKLADDAQLNDNATLSELVNVHGKGRFIITLDPNNKVPGQQPYQGIVPLDGDTLARVIENYMHQSEQLDTKLVLASDAHVSRGLLLQKLPFYGGTTATATNHVSDAENLSPAEAAQQAWLRACLLGSTLKRDELLATDCATLLHRLFWEETMQLFEPQPVHFKCSCSREKVGSMLTMLGATEVFEAVTSLGQLDINCDFCGKPYRFDAIDCAQLFVNSDNVVTPSVQQTH